ncbi:MAG: flagellar hook-associated protein FlgK [Clostridiales bacterium]|nr:flagellar hook-associated protein FlgK [Clostridiales bacterium]
MGNFSTFSVAASGLYAAQAGLYTTGHNMSNVDTLGYCRQRILQNDFLYRVAGSNFSGPMKVGLGTDISSINQIRNQFLDIQYRQENPKLHFYDVKYQSGTEIESIIGELQSDYRTQSVIQDLWDAINEIALNPEGLEVRGNFISTAVTFLDKADNVYNRLIDYQYNLDGQVREDVDKINQLGEEIKRCNELIAKNEISGDNANDYRDVRNNALDELSKLIKIDYKENQDGSVTVLIEGNELVANNVVNKLGLRYTSTDYSFVEPVFTNSASILPYDETGLNAKALFSLTGKVGSAYNNDNGHLKALLITRGIEPANSFTTPDEINSTKFEYERDVFNLSCTIPKVMREMDTLVNSIVKLVNNSVSPLVLVNAGPPPVYDKAPDSSSPYGIDENKSQHIEVFSRKYMDRFTGGVYNNEDPDNYYSLYTIGNIEINPMLLNAEDYDKIAFSASGDISDTTLPLEILDKWKSKFISYGSGEDKSIDDFYGFIVNNIGVTTGEAKNFVEEQEILVAQVDNKRKEVSGVSLDEEMTNMLTYQHAYNASARVVNVIDSMIDKIINGTGRVGI